MFIMSQNQHQISFFIYLFFLFLNRSQNSTIFITFHIFTLLSPITLTQSQVKHLAMQKILLASKQWKQESFLSLSFRQCIQLPQVLVHKAQCVPMPQEGQLEYQCSSFVHLASVIGTKFPSELMVSLPSMFYFDQHLSYKTSL